jgi:hypothetical protein
VRAVTRSARSPYIGLRCSLAGVPADRIAAARRGRTVVLAQQVFGDGIAEDLGGTGRRIIHDLEIAEDRGGLDTDGVLFWHWRLPPTVEESTSPPFAQFPIWTPPLTVDSARVTPLQLLA